MGPAFSGARWHKSTRSGNSGNCVEVAENLPRVVLVRDTKDGEAGPALTVAPASWSAFLAGVTAGEFDLR